MTSPTAATTCRCCAAAFQAPQGDYRPKRCFPCRQFCGTRGIHGMVYVHKEEVIGENRQHPQKPPREDIRAKEGR